MGVPQRQFLARLRAALTDRLAPCDWSGGQVLANCAAMAPEASCRRDGKSRPGERFELGDLRCTVGNATVIIEYESGGVALHNLLKYWPYLRGESSSRPSSAILLCHFSSWSSYGSYRNLWEWLASRMSADPSLLVGFAARQFDHWDAEASRGDDSIAQCLQWIEAHALRNGPLIPVNRIDS